MRRWAQLLIVLGVVVLLASPASGDPDDGFVYLLPDSTDRYRPAIEYEGRARVLANIHSITPPAMSPDGSQVAFSGAIGDESLGRYALYSVRSDGSGLRQITEASLGELDPAWAPDAQSLAIVQNQSGRLSGSCCRLALVDPEDGQVTALTTAVGAARPSFSSRGTYLLYDTPEGVWRISPSGGSPTLLAVRGIDATSSPNESSVIYVRRRATGDLIGRVSANGGAQTLLYQTSGHVENLQWRGSRIYFVEYMGMGYDGRKDVTFRSIDQGGGGMRIERSFSGRVVGASLAASNDEILFYRDDGLFRYYEIRPNGTLPSPIVAGDGYTANWSSIGAIDLDGDGQDEMFFYREDGLFRYYDIRPHGTLPSPMSAGDGYTTGWDAITAVDLDGDGQDEIFFYRDDGLFRYYHIRPDGNLPSPLREGDTYTENWDIVVDMDVDGDGQDEMLFYRSDGLYRIYNVKADATLGTPMQAGDDFGSNWSAISSIDLDGDGQDELLFYRSSGEFRYQEVQSDGSLGSVIVSGSGYTSGWSAITSVDLGPG